MICLHCGYCCFAYPVGIVVDPALGIDESNIRIKNGEERCPHLIGECAGEYSCDIHSMPWYEETPCFAHGQIEREDSPCRLGVYMMAKSLGLVRIEAMLDAIGDTDGLV